MSETKLPPLDVTQEVLPCPFCGQPPEIYEDPYDGDIECRTTGCIHISWRHKKDTVTWEQMLATWNHRAPNTELTAALEREEKLKEINQELVNSHNGRVIYASEQRSRAEAAEAKLAALQVAARDYYNDPYNPEFDEALRLLVVAL